MSKLDELIAQLCPDGVEYRNLEDCCNILDNRRKPVTKGKRENGKFPYYGANGIQDYVSDYLFDGIFVLVGEDGSVITESGTPVVTWAEGKIWVNNHAHIIEEDRDVLLRYLYHCLQTINVKNLIHGNIPKLNQGDFRKLRLPVPPIEIQRELVRILDTFTELTEELTEELSARRKQYEFYRNKMLTYDDTVSKVLLGDVTISISSGKNKGGIEDGKYPVFGPTGIVAKTDNPVYDHEQILVAHVGANAGYVHLASGQYDVSDNTLIVDVKRDYLLKYVYYMLVNMKLDQYAKDGSQLRITAEQLKKMSVPMPKYEVQQKIVNVLDNFDTICSDLNIDQPKDVEARRKQYEYYRDLLLTFVETGDTITKQTDRQSMIKLFWYVFGYVDIELSDVAEYQNSRIDADTVDKTNYVGVDNLLQNKIGKRNSDHVPEDGRLIGFEAGDILLGNIRPYLRKIWFADKNGGTNGDVLAISVTDRNIIYPRYLFHILSSENFFLYDVQNSKGAKMPRGDKQAIMGYRFTLPIYEGQKKVTDILDCFDSLCNDISEGIPAEIEARRQQYEYYRDKLLAFKEMNRTEEKRKAES